MDQECEQVRLGESHISHIIRTGHLVIAGWAGLGVQDGFSFMSVALLSMARRLASAGLLSGAPT